MLAFFAYCYWYIGISTPASVPGTMGADVWPKVLLVMLIILLSFNIIKVYRSKWKSGEKSQSSEKSQANSILISEMYKNKFLWGSIILLAYSLLLEFLGFILSTILFMLAYMTLLSEKRWWFKAIAGVATAFVLYALFAKILMVSLPRGVGILRDFALWLEMI